MKKWISLRRNAFRYLVLLLTISLLTIINIIVYSLLIIEDDVQSDVWIRCTVFTTNYKSRRIYAYSYIPQLACVCW